MVLSSMLVFGCVCSISNWSTSSVLSFVSEQAKMAIPIPSASVKFLVNIFMAINSNLVANHIEKPMPRNEKQRFKPKNEGWTIQNFVILKIGLSKL